MKKFILSIAIVLGFSMTTFAGPGDGGLFGFGATSNDQNSGLIGSREGVEFGDAAKPRLPEYGQNTDQDAPLGSGVIMLLGLGAAYAFTKKKEE